jgi:hypothetical protein
MTGAFVLAVTLAIKPLPTLRPVGERLLDDQGRAPVLRGANLGNWLLIEFWMLGLEGMRDQQALFEILDARFGRAERERLMDRYRRGWMAPRDWAILKSFGVNLMRLAMDYRLLEDDAQPKVLRKEAFRWIDHAVDQAERNGMYVILDLHGVQGGQSVYDHTGHAEQNKLWTETANQERAAWLWEQIAQRYRNRSAVVAYDLYNEPYGGTKAQQVALFQRLYPAVRRHDPDKLIFAHGNWDDFAHYGNPAERGWRNVGFQMHYYPGLFGFGSPTRLTHARHFARMAAVEAQQNRLNVPFLIGEFNVVFDSAGGPAMMRRHFDTYAQYRWLATMWSYKTLSREGGVSSAIWGMVTSRDPAPKVDFRTASVQEIERYFDSMGSMPLAVHERLRGALTDPNATPEPLPTIEAPITSAPEDPLPGGWQALDLGAARRGGQTVQGERIVLFGGGADIWNRADAFRFAHRPAKGDFRLEATVGELLDTASYAKAGLMVRQSLTPDSAHRLLSVFPSGEGQVAERKEIGHETQGVASFRASLPGARLRISRRGDHVQMEVAEGTNWRKVYEFRQAGPVWVGLVASSHDNSQLTRARYENVIWEAPNE